MNFEIYIGIGIVIGIVAVYLANKCDPYVTEEEPISNFTDFVGMIGAFTLYAVLAALFWPAVLSMGGLYVVYKSIYERAGSEC